MAQMTTPYSKADKTIAHLNRQYNRLFRRVTVRVGKPVEMADLIAGRISKDTCDVLNERIKASFAQLSGGRSLLPPVTDKKA